MARQASIIIIYKSEEKYNQLIWIKGNTKKEQEKNGEIYLNLYQIDY